MPINVAAYDLANRTSEVTADVVARLGFIPDRVEKKMTVGQQRRGRRKKKLKGRGGSVEAWGIFTSDALRKYAQAKGIKPFPSKKPARIQVLIARDDADVTELNAMIRDGSVEGGVKNYLSDSRVLGGCAGYAPPPPSSSPVPPSPKWEITHEHMLGAAAGVGITVLLLFIVVAVLRCCKRKRNEKQVDARLLAEPAPEPEPTN
jgi:hypothetical protein